MAKKVIKRRKSKKSKVSPSSNDDFKKVTSMTESQAKKIVTEEPEDLKRAPHSFVIKKGHVHQRVHDLMMDVRTVLKPFTASNLKVTKTNVVKDFVSVASMLNVTHMAIFTMTDKSVYMRLCRMPRGPTITFKVKSFCSAREVRSSIRRPFINAQTFSKQPLLVMNGFSGNDDMRVKLTASMFRNLFPSFDINAIDLSDIKRCVLLNFNPETEEIDFRHYAVRVRPVGISRAVKKIVASRRVPDLGRFKNIEEVMEKDGALTESEGEDDVEEIRQVTLTQDLGSKTRGNLAEEKSAIRLVEIGPRMTLSLFKIEEGLMDGEVLYHSIIQKTSKEIEVLKAKKRRLILEKAKRKKQQEDNVRRKRSSHSNDCYNDNDEDNDDDDAIDEEVPLPVVSTPTPGLKGILKKPIKRARKQ